MDNESNAPAAADVNRAYYEQVDAGRDDYWRKMAAPRFRMQTLVGALVRADPASLVDLGCGNGATLDEVARRLPGTRLAGIDLSDAQIRANRARDPAITWRCANLDSTNPLGDALKGNFEAISALEVIEHLDHPEAFLRTAFDLAVPGRGYLYLSTQSGPVRETERRVGHRRHYTTAEMREALVRTGWRPVRVWNAGFPFHDLSKWYANRDPDASMARFGDGAYGWSENLICAALRLAFRCNSQRRGAQLFAIAASP